MELRINFSILFSFSLLLFCLCTLTKDDRTKRKKNVKTKSMSETQATKQSKFYQEVIDQHLMHEATIENSKIFDGFVLSYVTPWNNKGYDIAKKVNNKFSHVSPVWLQIKTSGQGDYFITGNHDIDQKWVASVVSNKFTKMVPRIIFDGWNGQDFYSLFSSEENIMECVEVILTFIQKHKFAGVVIEVWSQLGGQLKKELLHFISHMGQSFKKAKKQLIIVIPPPVTNGFQNGIVTESDLRELDPFVTAFSLMTYDYSNPSRPGPNSPFEWMKECVEILAPADKKSLRKKLLLGLNFYGFDYKQSIGGNHILGDSYVKIIQKHKPLFKWHEKYKEHSFTYRDSEDHEVWYPTQQSIKLRIELAQELGTGISIWEIGQGLNHFYNHL